HCATKLRRPIQDGVDGAKPVRNPVADRYRWIQVPPGYSPDCDDHCAISEAIGEGSSQQPQARDVRVAQELVRADRPRTEKDQSEGAEKFGKKFLHPR